MDKKLILLGSAIIIILLGGLICYQKYEDKQNIIAQTETKEQMREETIEGYEDPQELIKYMLCQLQNGDLDLALRGCSVRTTAEVFLLQPYIEFMESYDPMEMIPPTDTDSPVYAEISELRLADYYAKWLEKCKKSLGPEHTVRLLKMEEDIPENPDGKYYETRSNISEILGARKVQEMLIYVEIDGDVKELRWTLVRHRKYWRVLLFTSFQTYGQDVPDIRKCGEIFDKDVYIEYGCEDILPVNYTILDVNSEQTPERLIERFFLYLIREDAWSAISYMELYDIDNELHTSVELLEKEAELAKQIQSFYYNLFFSDRNKYEWYFRDLSVRAKELVEDLKSDKIITMDIVDIQALTEPSDKSMVYQVSYMYNWNGYICTFTLENQGGWRIKSIEW